MIKAFNDGDRFCIVIQNCSEELRQQLIRQLNPELIGDLEAKPMENESESVVSQNEPAMDQNEPVASVSQPAAVQDEPVEEGELPNNELSRLYGAMNVLANFESLSAETDSAFKHLADHIELLPSKDRETAGNLLKRYLSIRFGNADLNLFMGMKFRQYKTFFNIFGSAIGPKMWEFSGINGEVDFFGRTQEEKDNFMKSLLSCFASAYKKSH